MGIFPSPLAARQIGHIDAQEQFLIVSAVLEPEERSLGLSEKLSPLGSAPQASRAREAIGGPTKSYQAVLTLTNVSTSAHIHPTPAQ